MHLTTQYSYRAHAKRYLQKKERRIVRVVSLDIVSNSWFFVHLRHLAKDRFQGIVVPFVKGESGKMVASSQPGDLSPGKALLHVKEGARTDPLLKSLSSNILARIHYRCSCSLSPETPFDAQLVSHR